tara:strand:- start:45 stop:803 length:759 start_codon:yes stop_codon:yes gene_type:complete
MIKKYSHIQGYSDLIAFQWFLNLTINKKLQTFVDIGSELDKIVYWANFATCHSVEESVGNNTFVNPLNIIVHNDSPFNIDAKKSEVQLVTSVNSFNKYNTDELIKVMAEINRITKKYGNFLLSIEVGNSKYEDETNGTYSYNMIRQILELSEYDIQKEAIVSPIPFLLTQEVANANTANEQVIDLFKPSTEQALFADTENSQYTYFIQPNVIDALAYGQYATLILQCTKRKNIVKTKKKPAKKANKTPTTKE